MRELKIDVQIKKGVTQTTRWGVVQTHPYPDVHSCGGLEWRNGGELFPHHGQPAQGIGHRYTCYLLVPEGEIPADHNRTHCAGYVTYNPAQETPGAIVLRGRSMGEMTVEFDAGPGLERSLAWPRFRVRGGSPPTDAEREFITAQILPSLCEFIRQNKATLFNDAITQLGDSMNERLRRARVQLDEMERQASIALDKAKKLA